MGLPIWRDPEEKDTKVSVRTDPTAIGRSPIRRRPSMNRGSFPRHPRWESLLERSHPGSPPPPPAMSPPPPLPVPAPLSSMFGSRHPSSARYRLQDLRSPYPPRAEREGSEARYRFVPLRESLGDSTGAAGHDYRLPLPDHASSERRTFLPTPPLDVSEQNEAARIDPGIPTISVQPAAGLGDRVRSPSPMTPREDAWQVMQESIRADGHLPSADSSFTSAAASASFTSTADAPDSQSTAPDHLADPDDGPSADVPCPYDSDSSLGSPSSSPLYPSRAEVNALRTRMEGNFSALQEQHEASILAYEDEITSLREDFNALRDRLRQIDPTAALPPPYPNEPGYEPYSPPLNPNRESHLTRRSQDNPSHSTNTVRPDFPFPPAYDTAVQPRRDPTDRAQEFRARAEEFFLPPRPHEPYGQYHLGVDRDGQVQLLPRDRTLTRVPSLRREDSQRETHTRVREHLRQRAEGQMREQTRRSLAAAGFTPEEVDRISDPRPPGERLRDEERRRQDIIDEIRDRERQRQREGERSGEDAASDVDSMRGILDRLSRRQDVPEGMWMGAGLSRDVVEPRADGPIEGIRVSERRGVRDGEGVEGREAGSGRVAGRGRMARVHDQL